MSLMGERKIRVGLESFVQRGLGFVRPLCVYVKKRPFGIHFRGREDLARVAFRVPVYRCVHPANVKSLLACVRLHRLRKVRQLAKSFLGRRKLISAGIPRG